MKKAMLALKYERFALNVVEILIFFFCFEICLFTICARVWWKEHSCLLKVKGCVLLLLYGFFFYSRIERKQNITFKR
jgi:hypothetical protein